MGSLVEAISGNELFLFFYRYGVENSNQYTGVLKKQKTLIVISLFHTLKVSRFPGSKC